MKGGGEEKIIENPSRNVKGEEKTARQNRISIFFPIRRRQRGFLKTEETRGRAT